MSNVNEEEAARPSQAVNDDEKKTDNAPKLPIIQLLAKFLWFGCRGMIFMLISTAYHISSYIAYIYYTAICYSFRRTSCSNNND